MNIETNIPAGGIWLDWSRGQIRGRGMGARLGGRWEEGPDWGVRGSGQMGTGARLEGKSERWDGSGCQIGDWVGPDKSRGQIWGQRSYPESTTFLELGTRHAWGTRQEWSTRHGWCAR